MTIHHIIPHHEWKVRINPNATRNDKDFNAEDNRVLLTTQQHAQAHQFLYELNNKIEDLVAWKGTAGLIGHDEAHREICRMNGLKTKGKKRSLETKEHMRLAAIERWNRPGQREAQSERNLGTLNPRFGKPQSEESNKKRSEKLMGRDHTWGDKISKAQIGVPRSQTTGEKNGRFSHGKYMKKAV